MTKPRIEFKESKDFTIGVELELQLIDPVTRDLKSACSEILKELNDYPNIKHEFYESEIEINSNICSDIDDLGRDLKLHVHKLYEAARKLNLKVAMAGTHPTANWSVQRVAPNKRYVNLANRIRMPMDRMLAFGIHVHVGLRSGPEAIAVNDGITKYLPHLLALSCSSPYWVKRDSGMESYRVKIIETLPITGLPYHLNTWEEFCELYYAFKKSGTVDSIREFWWDARPHPDFGTIEIRICDAAPLYDDVIALASLVQTLVAYLANKHRNGEKIDTFPFALLRQNKWRAARYGIEGDFIINKNGDIASVKDEVRKLITELQPIANQLKSDIGLKKINSILERGTSSTRQRKTFTETKGSWNMVVDSLINEFESSWQFKEAIVQK